MGGLRQTGSDIEVGDRFQLTIYSQPASGVWHTVDPVYEIKNEYKPEYGMYVSYPIKVPAVVFRKNTDDTVDLVVMDRDHFGERLSLVYNYPKDRLSEREFWSASIYDSSIKCSSSFINEPEHLDIETVSRTVGK